MKYIAIYEIAPKRNGTLISHNYIKRIATIESIDINKVRKAKIIKFGEKEKECLILDNKYIIGTAEFALRGIGSLQDIFMNQNREEREAREAKVEKSQENSEILQVAEFALRAKRKQQMNKIHSLSAYSNKYKGLQFEISGRLKGALRARRLVNKIGSLNQQSYSSNLQSKNRSIYTK